MKKEMRTATVPDIVDTYKSIFSVRTLEIADTRRISFLESIIAGEMPPGDTPAAIAAKAVRTWYDDPRLMPYQRMNVRISDAPEYRDVFWKFKECIDVLKKHRLHTLVNDYRDALQARNHADVESIGALITAFDDKETIEHIHALKAAYKYKPPRDVEFNFGTIIVSAAAIGIMIGAAYLALGTYKSPPRTPVESKELIEKPQTRTTHDTYIATQK